MATTLTGTVRAGCDWNFQNVLTLGNTVNQNTLSYANGAYTHGTGLSQVNKIYEKQHSISASSSLTLDLAGSLTDDFGNTITMTAVKAIIIELKGSSGASSIQVGNATNPISSMWGGATNTMRILKEGILVLATTNASGYAVTAGSADELKIANNDASNAATVNVVILGIG